TVGGGDWVSRPFEPRELSLRIASILRRARPAAAPAVESVRFGGFRFHLARGELKRGEEIVRLTDRERDMLRLLAATPGETVPRQALAGNGGATGERAVDVQVNRLRRKIEVDPANPLLVQTVRGIGYRLVTAPWPRSTSALPRFAPASAPCASAPRPRASSPAAAPSP